MYWAGKLDLISPKCYFILFSFCVNLGEEYLNPIKCDRDGFESALNLLKLL